MRTVCHIVPMTDLSEGGNKMEKSHIAVIMFSTMIAAIAGITGCNTDNYNSDSENKTGFSILESETNSTDNSDNASVSDISESTPESSDSGAEHRLTDDQLELISGLKMQSLVGPDGETLLMADAVNAFRDEGGGKLYSQELLKDANGDYIFDENGIPKMDDTFVDVMLTFDFAYMRYARPYFYAGEYFEDKDRKPLPETEWFKVREGDKLDCGLTVKKARFEMYPVLDWKYLTKLQTIELDGEITLEGMLFVTTNTDDYTCKVGDLQFMADPTKTEGIPVVRLDHDINEEWNNLNMFLDTESNEYYESDVGYMWNIGNVGDEDFDASAVFCDDSFVRVRATLKNVKLDVFDDIGGYDITADIVDIERIE